MREINNMMSMINGGSRMNYDNTPLAELPLTMVFIPMQPLDQVYGEEQALMAGTLFPNIDKPFTGKRWST